MAYASVDDVLVDLGRPARSDREREQIGQWLEQAEAVIRSRIPNLGALIAQGRLSVDVVKMVEVWVVARKVKNPDGKQYESVDDYRYGLFEDNKKGAIFLTEDEWALLLPRQAADAFTVRFRATPGFADGC